MTIVGPAVHPDVLALLLARVHHGDDDAFRLLYDHTQPRVSRVVTGTLRSPEQSAEVVQEVYLHVWQHAATFEPLRGTVVAWLTMIAHRRAVDRVRQVVSSNRREQRDAATTDRSVTDVAETGMARHEAAQLRSAIGRLSDRQREAVVLTYLQGYTYQQAAGLLSVPLGTLKTRVRAGVISLRSQLVADAA